MDCYIDICMVIYCFNNILEKMNISVEKAAAKNDLASKLSGAHDLLVRSAKIASIIGAISGFIYLLSYTTHVGIPFPLELSVLPTTLLIVGLTSIIGTFIVIAGMFAPVLTLDYNDEVTKGYRKADDLEADVVKARFSRYFFCTWAPTALALIGLMFSLKLIGEGAWLKPLGWLMMAVSVGWVFYIPKYVDKFLENRWQYFFINFLQIILSVFAYILIIIISIVIFPELGEWPAWSACLVALAIFTVCQIVFFVPSTESRNKKILLPPHFKHETAPAMGAAFILAGVWTALSVTMPQVNYKIGGAALRAFHVGGNVPVTICLKTKPAAAISQRFNFDADYCSEKLSMKLDSGDRVYVSKSNPNEVAGQQNAKFLPEAVYFRQDEIKQKIYYRQKEVEQKSK
jgi:hypothetical protein